MLSLEPTSYTSEKKAIFLGDKAWLGSGESACFVHIGKSGV